jgi:hypothetical protein
MKPRRNESNSDTEPKGMRAVCSFIIHVMLPRSLEEFYEQVGRAGRDGKPARCILIFSDGQPALAATRALLVA